MSKLIVFCYMLTLNQGLCDQEQKEFPLSRVIFSIGSLGSVDLGGFNAVQSVALLDNFKVRVNKHTLYIREVSTNKLSEFGYVGASYLLYDKNKWILSSNEHFLSVTIGEVDFNNSKKQIVVVVEPFKN